MSFGVFIHRADSIYEDSPAVQYQFPRQYFGRASACEGDWIVYYEPTKVPNSRGYFAVAQVEQIVEDRITKGMYLARIVPGSYMDFATPVPFVIDNRLVEKGLLNAKGHISGRAQAAVRALSSDDFQRIVSLGVGEDDAVLPRKDTVQTPEVIGFEETQISFETERERPIVLTSRKLRDKNFRSVVLRAYDSRCAITGLKFVNGGGRAEVEAAHIHPVEANGPDIVNNGMPLSGTAHWMFDRGLLSVSDDLEILVSRRINDRDGVEKLVNSTGRLIGPINPRDRPHPMFLRWHRDNCFKV